MRGGIDVHTHGIDAILHHALEGTVQTGGLHIVLILAHTDALGVDLDQLGQGVLQASGDGHSRALHHVEIGEFLGGQFGGRVDGRAGLADNDILGIPVQLLENIRDELLALAGGGAVSDGIC